MQKAVQWLVQLHIVNFILPPSDLDLHLTNSYTSVPPPFDGLDSKNTFTAHLLTRSFVKAGVRSVWLQRIYSWHLWIFPHLVVLLEMF